MLSVSHNSSEFLSYLIRVLLLLRVSLVLQFYVWVFCLQVCLYTSCTPGSHGGVESAGTGVAEGCSPSYGNQESRLDLI